MFYSRKYEASSSPLQIPHPDLTPPPPPTFVPRDRDDVSGGGRQAKDVSALDTPLGLHIVLEGAVDPR